ncbi:MAG: IPT/TIG domain-containing protein [Labilithrix sp.]|nr:IPT/TIG domain-containing protein [Labilithrix sp.]
MPSPLRRLLLPAALAWACVLLALACTAPPVPDFEPPAGTKKKRAPTVEAGAAPEGGEAADPAAPGDPPAEAPTLTAVTPDSVTVGEAPAGVTLTLTGTRFVAGTTVDLAGATLPATLTSPNELTVEVPGARLAAAGVLELAVVSPAAGPSNALAFTVANPTAVSIASLTPAAAPVGASTVELTVAGAGFIAASTVRFNGAALPTTFRSATELGATIPAAALADAGRFGVTVANGADVLSLPSPFEVTNPAPTLTALSPKSAAAGAASLVVTLDGSGFTRTSEVLAGQTPLATTFVSAERLRATLPASLLAAAGAHALRVQTAAPGGGASAAQTFTVTGAAAACTYACADYGYAPGECFEGWTCNATTGCLQQQACGGAGAASCVYRCADYGYAPGQCAGGWLCLASGQYAGCLGRTTCD